MKGIWYILISVLFNVFGQISMRKGMMMFGEVNLTLGNFLSTVIQVFTKPFVILGLIFYAVGTIFWLTALSKAELSFAYPMLSLGYVLIFFLSWILLDEKVSLLRFSGIALICLGLFLVART